MSCLVSPGSAPAIEVARWVSRRARRPLIHRKDLLWGVLADGSSESVRILRHYGADLPCLWTGLRRWHRSV